MTISTKKSMRRILAFVVTIFLILSPTSIYATEFAGDVNNLDRETLLTQREKVETTLYNLNNQKRGYIDTIADLNIQKANLEAQIYVLRGQLTNDEIYEETHGIPPETPEIPGEQESNEQKPCENDLTSAQTPQTGNESQNDNELDSDNTQYGYAEVPYYYELEAHHNAYIPEACDMDADFGDNQTIDEPAASTEESAETSLLASIVQFFVTPVFAFDAYEYNFETKPQTFTNSATLEELEAQLANVIAELAYYNTKVDALLIEIAYYENRLYGIKVALGELVAIVNMTKTASITRVVPTGQQFYYTITITNSGNTAALGITLVSDFSPYLSFVSTDAEGIGARSGDSFTINLGNLAAGDQIDFDIVVSANSLGTNVIREASIATTVSGNNFNSQNSVFGFHILPAGSAQLRLTTTATPASVEIGQLVTFTFMLENIGNSSASTAMVITSPIPTGLTFVRTSSGAFNTQSRRLELTLQDFPQNGTYTFTATFRVTGTQLGPISTIAYAYYCGKHVHDENEIEITVIPPRQPDRDGDGDWWGDDSIIHQPQPQPQPDDVIVGDYDVILRDEDEDFPSVMVDPPRVPLAYLGDAMDGDYIERIVPVGYVPQTGVAGNSGFIGMLLSLLALALLGKKRKTNGFADTKNI